MLQDVRGCGPKTVSGKATSPCELPGHGQFTFPNTSWHDGYDTVEWITKQPWSNGKVVLDGPSALVRPHIDRSLEVCPSRLDALKPAHAERCFNIVRRRLTHTSSSRSIPTPRWWPSR